MGYGETTVAEELAAHKLSLLESEEVLGVTVLYLAPPTSQVIKDRLGSTSKVIVPSVPVPVHGGALIFEPSQLEYELARISLQAPVDCLLTVSLSKLPANFDKINGLFIISTPNTKAQQYKVSKVKEFGHVGDEFVYLAIGLVVK